MAHLQHLIESLQKADFKEPACQDFIQINPRLNSSEANQKIIIDYLQAILSSSQKITFEFAQRPDRDFINELVSWVRSTISPSLLVDIQFQPGLIGGFTVRSSRKIYDYSWASQLDKYKLEEIISSAV